MSALKQSGLVCTQHVTSVSHTQVDTRSCSCQQWSSHTRACAWPDIHRSLNLTFELWGGVRIDGLAVDWLRQGLVVPGIWVTDDSEHSRKTAQGLVQFLLPDLQQQTPTYLHHGHAHRQYTQSVEMQQSAGSHVAIWATDPWSHQKACHEQAD